MTIAEFQYTGGVRVCNIYLATSININIKEVCSEVVRAIDRCTNASNRAKMSKPPRLTTPPMTAPATEYSFVRLFIPTAGHAIVFSGRLPE